ncbi:hypothetical protein V8E53_005724 [Lactarius tabidus]
MESRSICPLSLAGDPSSSETPHTRQISLKKGKNLRAQGESYRRATTIHILSDDVLLELFDSYRKIMVWGLSPLKVAWPWHLLVYVCQRWRQVIFASPHRLNLHLLCTFGTPVKKNLGIWPPFPLIVDYPFYRGTHPTPSNDEDNVIAALEHHNRVCYVNLYPTSPQLERMVTAMQKPFPVLKYLSIFMFGRNAPVLPTEFLGGCAPCLQEVRLSGIPYPALPTLLLSTTHLVTLCLRHIPPTSFISPKKLVVRLAALPRLECFILTFQSVTPSRASPDRTPPPLAARTVLPALTSFEFGGTSEYLENLVAQVDSPQLDRILITYLDQPDNFQVDQLSKFVSRSVSPHLAMFKHAEVALYKDRQLTDFDMSPSPYSSSRYSNSAGMSVSCYGNVLRVSPLAQTRTSG